MVSPGRTTLSELGRRAGTPSRQTGRQSFSEVVRNTATAGRQRESLRHAGRRYLPARRPREVGQPLDERAYVCSTREAKLEILGRQFAERVPRSLLIRHQRASSRPGRDPEARRSGRAPRSRSEPPVADCRTGNRGEIGVSFWKTRSNVARFRAAEGFSTEGRAIKQGEVLEPDDPLVPFVLERRPDLLVALWLRRRGINA
jgi:hypothetical protein